MRTLSTNFSNISNQKVIRLDAGYRYFFDVKDALTWDIDNSIELSKILIALKTKKIEKGELEIEERLIDLANIDRRFNSLSNIVYVSEIGSDKAIIKEGDIVIPKMQPRLGNIFTNTEHDRYIGSSELIEYACNNKIIKVKLLYYLLTHVDFQKSLLYTESGKTHRRVSPEDILRYKIPSIPLKIQAELIKEIEKTEKKIEKKREQRKSITETVNIVFSNYFNLDFSITDALRKKLIYYSNLIETANEELKFDISLKYRRLFRDNIYIPSLYNWIPLDRIVTIRGGKRLPKGEDVTPEDTGYKYVRVDDLNVLGHFDIDNIQYISEKNHLKIEHYIAKENDILLTIVGATVGKCGIVPKELDGENISENFARLIINDKKKFLPLYILYILMSKIGQYQIEEYKGRGSQGKLAIFRIKKILIPEISFKEQKNIVNQIHKEVKKQTELNKEMATLRNRIDETISSAIMKL